ncbi:cytochrome P450 [Lasiosphaeris hirsuta]|uniref:Cytochrome P450 n=1 Tax=Lasiosphaeris hirsuta TaxID=260670 RepID=A0AA40AXZ5_9PEZI|nr:cytochrome P450 [Lasiosphaeris hirsuta]
MASVVQPVLQALGDKLPLVLSTLGALVAVIIFQIFLTSDPLSNLPEVGQEFGSISKRRVAYLNGATKLYQEGYEKVVVISPKYLVELKKLPDNVLSFDGAVAESMHVKYTKLSTDATGIATAIKSSLTPALPRLSLSLADEVEASFRAELPPCDDWTPVKLNKKLLRIVAMASGRVFVGPELCRDEKYLDAAINYTIELINGRRAVDAIPPWKRPFVAPWLPEIRALEGRIKQADNFLRPIVEERKRLGKDEEPDDMLAWLMASEAKHGTTDSKRLAKLQLDISFAAIHTTSIATTNCFYQLAADPTLAPILRDEIRSVLAEHNGQMTAPALQAMKKLDSFIKEAMRLDPTSATSFQRKVLKQFTMSNGQVIPAGVVVEVPAIAVAFDPELFPNPTEFQPFRFSEMREKSGAEAAAKEQFVSVSTNHLTFGYGRHACPGRFLAANEIKMILATAVLMYDIRNVNGVEGRYPNLVFGSSSVPDPSRELLMKRIV